MTIHSRQPFSSTTDVARAPHVRPQRASEWATRRMRPQFSIIVPCFNASQTLDDALRSVLGQRGVEYEVIVVDDGSTDDTARTIMRYCADARFRYLMTKRRGAGAARNAGARLAQGSILAFLDADDRLRPGALFEHFKAFNRESLLGLSFGRVRICLNDFDAPHETTRHCPHPDLAQLIGDFPLCTSSNMVIRREAFDAIGPFNETLLGASDREWVARAHMVKEWRVRGLNAVTVDKRLTRTNAWAHPAHMQRCWRAVVARLRARDPGALDAAYPVAHALFHRHLAKYAALLGLGPHVALRHLAIAFRESPTTFLAEPCRTAALGLRLLAAPRRQSDIGAKP